MESPADDIQLLLPGQLDEIHRVAGYPDSKLGIKLRMLHSVKQNISIQNIYVDVVAALLEIAIQQSDEVGGFLVVVLA